MAELIHLWRFMNEWMNECKSSQLFYADCWQLCCVLQIKMNVFWHRPSQQSSAFMYITSRMSNDGDTKGASSLSPSTTTTTVSPSNIGGATHDLCHLPTYQRDLLLSKFNALSRRIGRILVPGSVRRGTSASHLCVFLVFIAFNLLNRYCSSRRLESEAHTATPSAGTLGDQHPPPLPDSFQT